MNNTELPIHPRTGLQAVGLLDDGRPVWPIRGGAVDDEGDDDDLGIDVGGGQPARQGTERTDASDDDDDEKDDSDGVAVVDDWKPPTREEWDRVQQSLKAANDEAKKHRLRLRELRKTARTAPAGQQDGMTGDADVEQVRAAALEEAKRAYKPVAVRAAAIAELVKANFRNPTDTRLNRMIRRLDMDELDVDPESGAVEGLEDQIADLQDEFPELFGKDDPEPEPQRPARQRAPRINAANRQNAAPEPKTTGEKHAARILGR